MKLIPDDNKNNGVMILRALSGHSMTGYKSNITLTLVDIRRSGKGLYGIIASYDIKTPGS